MATGTNGDGWFNLSCGLFVGFGVVAVICWIAFDNLFWRIVICIYFVGIPTLAALLGMIGDLLPGRESAEHERLATTG